MPTSSQAMIVMSGEGEDPRIPRRRYGGSSEFSVANYDMELALRLKNIGFLNQGVSGTGLPAPSSDSMASVLKALSTGQGSYDPVRKVYRWQVSNTYRERRPLVRSSETNTTENIVWFPDRERVNHSKTGNKEINLPKLYGWSGSTPNAALEDAGIVRKRKTSGSRVPELPPHSIHVAADPRPPASVVARAKFVLCSDGHQRVSVESLCEPAQAVGDSVKNTAPETPKPPKLSLLEDVKKRVNYDCRVHPAMYMRKHRPPPNPFAVCFSFRENDNYNHTEVKDVLESQIGLKVRSVQYDPLSIRSSDADVGTRWIVTYATPAECEFAVSKGLEVNGDKIAIKLLDDVINCECEAYILHKEEERQKRIAEGNQIICEKRKRRKKQKVFVSTSTNT